MFPTVWGASTLTVVTVPEPKVAVAAVMLGTLPVQLAGLDQLPKNR